MLPILRMEAINPKQLTNQQLLQLIRQLASSPDHQEDRISEEIALLAELRKLLPAASRE